MKVTNPYGIDGKTDRRTDSQTACKGRSITVDG